MIRHLLGDILDDPSDIVVVPVDCVGAMAAGLAARAAAKWPHVELAYRQECLAGRVAPGRIHVVSTVRGALHPSVVLLPTNWGRLDPPRLDFVADGLAQLRAIIDDSDLSGVSISLPALDELPRALVRPLMERALGDLPNEVLVYQEPEHADEALFSRPALPQRALR